MECRKIKFLGIYQKILELLKVDLFKAKKKKSEANFINDSVYVTIDWGGNPITTIGDGYILPRKIEMIINQKYYPTGTVGEWPCDPISGERLPIIPRK